MHSLLPRSPQHRAACIAVFLPLVLFALTVLAMFGPVAVGRGQLSKLAGVTFAMPAILVFGPFAGLVTVSGGIRVLIPSSAIALPALYFVVARTRAGAMVWPWALLLACIWYAAGLAFLYDAAMGV